MFEENFDEMQWALEELENFYLLLKAYVDKKHVFSKEFSTENFKSCEKMFNDTAEQAEALMPEAIVSMETTPYGGVRALVRRELAPVGFQLEKPTIEDIILALVKGEKQ